MARGVIVKWETDDGGVNVFSGFLEDEDIVKLMNFVEELGLEVEEY